MPSPGLLDILPRLTVPFCVASSSQLERIRLSLELTGLLDWFEPNIFSATMVENGKPAPDLFLHAAAKMGADPSRCLVIEDSPAGITAARAAGMRVFGLSRRQPHRALGPAHRPSKRCSPTSFSTICTPFPIL